MKILRQALGVLSLAVGLVLLGECAAHTAKDLLHVHPQGGSSALLLKLVLFSPGSHGLSYNILLASGIVLLLMGMILTRAWALPFFAFAIACLALSGGIVVERVVAPKGVDAFVLQDGISGVWGILGREDALMTFWMGVAALICGLFLNHGIRFNPSAVPAPDKDKKARGKPSPPAADHSPMTLTPANPAEAGEAREETSVDLDLSPDLETSEVQAPDPLSGEPEEGGSGNEMENPSPSGEDGLMEPMTLEESPTPALVPEPEGGGESPSRTEAPYVMELEGASASTPAPEPAPMPEPEVRKPPVLLPAAGILLGLGSLGAAAASGLSPLAPHMAGLVWAGAASAGFAGMGLALLSRPLKALGWAAVGLSAMGLAGAATLLILGHLVLGG